MADQIKNSTVYGKHDEFFRRIYSFSEFAKDLIELGLGRQTLGLMDPDKIQQESERFGDKTADFVFSVPLKRTREEDFRFFIVKSRVLDSEKVSVFLLRVLFLLFTSFGFLYCSPHVTF